MGRLQVDRRRGRRHGPARRATAASDAGRRATRVPQDAAGALRILQGPARPVPDAVRRRPHRRHPGRRGRGAIELGGDERRDRIGIDERDRRVGNDVDRGLRRDVVGDDPRLERLSERRRRPLPESEREPVPASLRRHPAGACPCRECGRPARADGLSAAGAAPPGMRGGLSEPGMRIGIGADAVAGLAAVAGVGSGLALVAISFASSAIRSSEVSGWPDICCGFAAQRATPLYC